MQTREWTESTNIMLAYSCLCVTCIWWEGKMSWIIIFARNSVAKSQIQHKCRKNRTHAHIDTHKIKPYPCLFINTPRIFAYNIHLFQSSCGLLFHKVYVWLSHLSNTTQHKSSRKYCIDFNKQTSQHSLNNEFPIALAQWNNDKVIHSTNCVAKPFLPKINQSRPQKRWTTTTAAASMI